MNREKFEFDFEQAEFFCEDGTMPVVRGDISQEEAYRRIIARDAELTGEKSHLEECFDADELRKGVAYWEKEDSRWFAVPEVALVPDGTEMFEIWFVFI